MPSDQKILFEKILELALKDKLVLLAGMVWLEEVENELLICAGSLSSSKYSINHNHNGN